MKGKILFLPILLIVTVLGAIYALDISQKNPETLFLTDGGKKSYLNFKDEFNEMQYLIAVHKLEGAETLESLEVQPLL